MAERFFFVTPQSRDFQEISNFLENLLNGDRGVWDVYSVSWSIVEHVGMIFQVSKKFEEKKKRVLLVEKNIAFHIV